MCYIMTDINDIANDQLYVLKGSLPEDPLVNNAIHTLSQNIKPDSPEYNYQKIIDGLLEQIEELKKQAFTDNKTGYLNANAFDTILKNRIKERLQNNGTESPPITVVMVDLNYLKPLNNMSYHKCGDKAIEYLTNYLSENLRTDDDLSVWKGRKNENPHKDIFTRLSGGDEFGIIMHNCTPEQARSRLEPIFNQMAIDSIGKEKPCMVEDKIGRKFPIQIAAAFGCAQIPDLGITDNSNPNNIERNITAIINSAMTKAANEEQADKTRSRTVASQIEGGFPFCGNRDDAEKIIGDFLEKLARKLNNGRVWKKIAQDLPPDYSAEQIMVGAKQIFSPSKFNINNQLAIN